MRSVLQCLCLLSPLCLVQAINLFDDGARGPLLGSTFGVPGVNATFDYIVVGGGTAGLTIATRLSQTQGLSVAVVEAGGFYEIDNGNITSIPGFAASSAGVFQPLIDWGIQTVPQNVTLLPCLSEICQC